MPVSGAGLLVSGDREMLPAGPSVLQTRVGVGGVQSEQRQFVRGDKTSSSVRLRKRKDDVSQPGRKINRHSGDFSYFSPRRDENSVKHCPRLQDKSESETVVEEGAWNYISCTPEVRHVSHVSQPPPVLVKMRESANMNQVRMRPTSSNLPHHRAVSASVMNIQHPEPSQYQPAAAAFRKSGDFSLFDPALGNYKVQHLGEIEDGNNIRRRPHARSHSQQPIKMSNNNLTQDLAKMPLTPSSGYVHVNPSRSSVQTPSSSSGKVKRDDTHVAAKRCSGEFEFKRMNRKSGDFHQLSHVLAQELDKAEEQSFVERMISRELYGDSGSEGSEESGIFSTGSSHESPRKEVRRPGLGRRAITQVNMRQEKKNSYNNALAKSQENLVKVCIACCR